MKNIVLTGMMGAGKTTIGKELAQRMTDFLFVDLDNEIENELDVSISEIFTKHGETYFRDLESKFLDDYCTQNNLIISTGGGVVERRENLSTMKKNSVVFYLSAPVVELYERVKKTSHRPLLKHPDPCAKIKELMDRREKYYKTAHFEICTENREISEIADEIVEKYKSYGK